MTFTYEGDDSTERLTFSTLTNITFATTGTGNTPPSADAGEDISIYTSEQALTVLQGTAADDDGDALTYRWLEGTTELKAETPVPADGIVTLDLSTIPQIYLPGLYSELHTLTLEVSDASVVTTDLIDVSVFNTPPEAQPAPASQTVEVNVDAILITGEVADFDGDSLSYQWLTSGDLLDSGAVSATQGGDVVFLPDLTIAAGDPRFPVGLHAVHLTVDDGVNASVSGSVTVEVTDSTAPTLAPTASVTMLWPPNHTLRPVTIWANAADNGGGAITLSVSVESNEPDDGDGDGCTEQDWVIDSVDSDTGVIELQLRAERSGTGDGRVYTVTITATDESGNSSTATVEVCVPHDRRKRK